MQRETSETCSLHQVSLVRGVAEIHYGLIPISSSYLEAARTSFPNAHSFVLGGCIVGPGNPVSEPVRYCPQCREAERAWHEAHPRWM